MILLPLIAVLLVGSPRDIANRIVKHGKKPEMPPIPQTVQKPVSSLGSTQSFTLTLSFDNTNATEQLWVLESTTSLNPPAWKVVLDGIIPAGGTIDIQVDHKEPCKFYRVGFVWP